ncbi:hypothetical protein L211DRAFT_229207 [Terfezia boudieri ATCC MYA-4762]|uniref:Uncharacterized protein n=1 Tax=Terfezia boudieri ATCC MYA-4762 TaxID=1051890 RepID=A0A3N4LTE6_9PEZI|nr:hypothetical protein L211DRAFT_229207 [Terfezia boudieri ATCC MYA-4762]
MRRLTFFIHPRNEGPGGPRCLKPWYIVHAPHTTIEMTTTQTPTIMRRLNLCSPLLLSNSPSPPTGRHWWRDLLPLWRHLHWPSKSSQSRHVDSSLSSVTGARSDIDCGVCRGCINGKEGTGGGEGCGTSGTWGNCSCGCCIGGTWRVCIIGTVSGITIPIGTWVIPIPIPIPIPPYPNHFLLVRRKRIPRWTILHSTYPFPLNRSAFFLFQPLLWKTRVHDHLLRMVSGGEITVRVGHRVYVSASPSLGIFSGKMTFVTTPKSPNMSRSNKLQLWVRI